MNSSRLSETISKEIPSLDGWRAIAIIIVVLSHIGFGKWIPGGLGVTIFFFLSGYLITTLLCDEFQKNKFVSIKNFYIRRALRLTPPLTITLLLASTLTYIGIFEGGVTFLGVAAQLLYFANYYALFFDTGNTTPAGTGVFWSLAVEEHFYFLYPFIFLKISFHSRNEPRKLAYFLLISCLVVLLWRIVLVLYFHSNENRTYYATDTRIDSIIYGCILALVKNPRGATNFGSTLKLKDWSIILFSVLALLASIFFRNALFRETVRYSIQGAALAPLFYYSIAMYQNKVFRIFNWGAIKTIGKYSYSIYLVHYILIENMKLFSDFFIVNLLIVFASTFVYVMAIEVFVDRPIRQIRSRYK